MGKNERFVMHLELNQCSSTNGTSLLADLRSRIEENHFRVWDASNLMRVAAVNDQRYAGRQIQIDLRYFGFQLCNLNILLVQRRQLSANLL